MTDTREPRPGGEVVVYEASGAEVSISVRLEQETVWLTERQMADVFRTTRQNVNPASSGGLPGRRTRPSGN